MTKCLGTRSNSQAIILPDFGPVFLCDVTMFSDGYRKAEKLVRDNPVQAAAGALAVLLVAGVVAFTIYLNGQGNNKGFAVEGSRLIVVKDGMTTADIAELLHEKSW